MITQRRAETGRRIEIGTRRLKLNPITRASTPLVTNARVAPRKTTNGARYRAVRVAVMICPMSPHSEKRMDANGTNNALGEWLSYPRSAGALLLRLNQIIKAVRKNVTVLVVATREVGSSAITLPSRIAARVFMAKAAVNPQKI